MLCCNGVSVLHMNCCTRVLFPFCSMYITYCQPVAYHPLCCLHLHHAYSIFSFTDQSTRAPDLIFSGQHLPIKSGAWRSQITLAHHLAHPAIRSAGPSFPLWCRASNPEVFPRFIRLHLPAIFVSRARSTMIDLPPYPQRGGPL